MTDGGTDMSELKPCPFCGCTTLNKIVVTDRGAKNRMWSKILSWRVECDNCGAMSGETSNEENATFAWNRRAE